MSGAAGGATFPWRRAMELGLGRLGRSPQEFWAMTPKELEAAVAGAIGFAPMPISREELEGLMARFPDPDMETD
ncbi:MAG: rcc01693 family protein [Hyphomicrobiales bacterium]